CVPPLMFMVSAVIVIVPGGKPGLPPSVAVLICALYRSTRWAGSVDSGRIPEIVIVPGGPPLLSRPPLGLLRNSRSALVIGVPSGFVFMQRVFTLNTILPAGPAAPDVVTKMVRLLSDTVSAVTMIGPGFGNEPLTMKVSISVLLSATSCAGSVDSGFIPE